jgi:CCR4-NOT transcription complex subunit 1
MDNPPTTNIHTIVKAQIVFLISTLTEENFERNQLEIRSVRVLITTEGVRRGPE